MKLEIEITEAEIKDAIERKIREAIANQNNAYSAEDYIKGRVKAIWTEAVDKMALELIGNSKVLQEKIDKVVEARVKARVVAALKTIN
jgi:polyhydroxyalkanoate synthesis regulator phasin